MPFAVVVAHLGAGRIDGSASQEKILSLLRENHAFALQEAKKRQNSTLLDLATSTLAHLEVR